MLPAHPRSWGPRCETTDTTSLIKQRGDKLPHDASVFVGSLPSNIEQMDLTRMLMEHLSEHTQIKNIKVVRDSKGGVCAFVQCENATSATALIQTLHSSAPKPFLGRILRYEPARAFRTLLVSYRTPTQMARHGNISDSSDKPIINAEILELPNAMRIWKQRHSRFHSILYNSEAIEVQENGDVDDSLVADNVVFLHPLAFDAAMLQTIASYFGRLESFIPLKTLKHGRDDEDQASDDENSLVEYALYPAPHNAPRSPRMDYTCWEIKWDHRDDCVSALMTLRRVPHLTVTWAHQPASSDYSNHPSHYQASGFPLYPLHVQDCSTSAQLSPASPTTMSASGNDTKINVVPQPVRRHIECNAFQGRVSGFIQDLNISGSRHESRNSPTAHPDAGYPSLIGCDTTHGIKYTLKTSSHVSETNKADSDSDEEQELFMPQTPALDTSSITPITPGSQFPITPTSCDDKSMRPKTLGERENPIMNRSDRELDPTTLFVGGLEMFGPGAWDEEKVKNFFARFGGLESVKVVRPLNSCAAFAFVKFNNAESPARAVLEEHNRVYEGRAMRVQLRDCNPPRSPWKYVRGRGRPQRTHVGIQRRLDYKSPFDGQDQNLHRDRTTSFKGPETNDGDEIQLSSLVLPRTQSHSNADMALPSGTIPAPSPDLASSANTTAQSENYREWYDELESPAHTPAPSSLGSSISTTGASFSTSPYPYPLPNRQFYPTPWMHPFMQQPPYHVPYYPIYPGAAPNPTPSLTSPGSDTRGPAIVPHWPHLSMYGSYIPYPVLPPRPHDTDPGQPHHINAQAPLVPTGFIQNDQGTLVAVYHPEALDQYLARTQGSPAPPPTNIGMQRWVLNTARPYESGGSVAGVPHTKQATNQGQMRSLPSLPSIRPQQFSEFQRSYPPFGAGDGTPSPLSRRHGGRREPELPFTPGRSNPRFFGGRTFRPVPPMKSGQAHPSEIRQQSSTSAAGWNKWNAGR
ncbi:hypothetical protein BYT27DRAFT_7189890 [Phlegmacium glaucopus]|nr:hypothetical protein BYT27DRAFT_7189890 [Phlegmacium glaucopus]